MSINSSSPSVSSTDDDHDPTPVGPSTDPLTDEPSTRVPDRFFRDEPTADGFLSCGCSSKGRNLVVCIDGTANQFSEKNTNIVELYSRLIKDDEQLTYYNSGIGTYARPSWVSWGYIKQLVDHVIDMAIAWNFERIVLSAYQWLSENHKEGDRIFLFGFSRGAYQARVIAGMINKVGLLHKGNNDQIPFAYELYMATTETSIRDDSKEKPNRWQHLFYARLAWLIHILTLVTCFLFYSAYDRHFGLTEITRHIDIWYIYVLVQTVCASVCIVHGLYSSRDSNSLDKAQRLCERFKRTLSKPNVKVHFVGAWDTVSSIGITRGPSLPETTTGMTHVCYFRHALALDELRIKFMPEYANGGAGPPEVGRGLVRRGHVKEVWFPGSHSDIGGGNVENTNLNLFGPSLRWESYEGIQCGLKMEPYKGEWGSITPVKSLTGIWKLFELWPFRRLTYKDEDSTTYWPHLGDARIVQKGQLIHETVFEAIANPDRKYTPHARLWHDENGWDHLEDLKQKLIERDPYTSAVLIVSRLKEKNANNFEQIFNEQINELSRSLSEDIFCQSITEVPGAVDILLSALEVVCKWEGRDTNSRKIAVEALCKALDQFPPQPQKAGRYRASDLWAVSSALNDHDKSRLLDILCKVGNSLLHGPFEGNDPVKYCAFAPDGKHVFLGSHSSWAIWKEGTDKPEKKLYKGNMVESVVFSADGTRIATGLTDGTVLVWDLSTGKVVKGSFEGHTSQVSAIAFSPDATRIASGSGDGTICVWDVTTGEVIGPMEGHTDRIGCVAFSPNGTHIVSCSDDNTIRVWDVTPQKEVMEPRWEHTGKALAVAYSPDGTCIVSAGSWDGIIRVWDAERGEEVMKPLQGHTEIVLAVAYSLDGRRIASGSWDGTIRVWDAMTGKMLGVLKVGHDVYSVAFSPDGKRIVSGSWNPGNERSFDYIWDAENPELWPDT